jgi:hypothetical protein
MYMAGRLRTASSPLRTLMLSAVYFCSFMLTISEKKSGFRWGWFDTAVLAFFPGHNYSQKGGESKEKSSISAKIFQVLFIYI